MSAFFRQEGVPGTPPPLNFIARTLIGKALRSQLAQTEQEPVPPELLALVKRIRYTDQV